MELAYIISAYRYPEQVARLIHRLSADSTSFFVHVDRKTEDRVFDDIVNRLRGHPAVYFLKRHTCAWGGFGHVRASLKGIAQILRTGIRFDYAILLTGQDYPIKPNREIMAFFEQHRGELFLEFFPLPNDRWENRGIVGGMERIEVWHWRLGTRHWRFPPGQNPLIRRRFPSGFRPFGGSSYWCLSRDCIQYIHDFTTRNRAFTNFFKRVDVPDEIFFQTIILNSPFRPMVVNDDLRYIEWNDPTSGSPAILRVSDFANLVATPDLFARKFDARVDAKVLDLIDQQILGV